jgi:polyferredoxin
MLFDFCFFREQTCIVACPYGRFQSVLLDRRSLIVGYDTGRGEPRAPWRRGEQRATASTAACASPSAPPASTSARACRWSASPAPSASTPVTRS